MAPRSVRIVGLARVRANLRKFGAAGNKALKRQLHTEANLIAGASKDRFVPVDEGVLRSSIHAPLPSEKSGVVIQEIVAGGPAAPYAARQHEDMTLRHTVGGPKYLERPVLEALDSGLNNRLADAVGKAVKGAGE